MDEPEGCRYEDEVFLDALLRTIGGHDPSRAFFAFWAPHVAHTPLMVPKVAYDHFAHVADWRRRRYLAMVYYIDGALGTVVQALKDKNMYDNTLIVMSSDNGGPVYERGAAGASNYPLRGGKRGNFEGGIRANGFVSGGLVPHEMRGRQLSGLTTLWDWYATLAEVAGVDDVMDVKAATYGLPPVDSISQWAYWSGKTKTPPRTSIVVGKPGGTENDWGNATVQGMIVDKGADGLWKLLVGKVIQDARCGPSFPNATTDKFDDFDCQDGCLFRIDTDASEHHDLAREHADVKIELEALRVSEEPAVFNPNRGKQDPQSCVAALEKHGGFWGPWVSESSVAAVV